MTLFYGFIPQLSSIGEEIRWPEEKSTFLIYYSNIASSLNSEDIFSDTLDQIEKELNITFLITDNFNLADITVEQSDEGSSGTEVINFTSDHEAAKTILSHDGNRILKAKIYFNSAFNISTETSAANFIGNIFSHEIGHSLGLAHSSVVSSTMYPYLSQGQHKLEEDDFNLLRKYFGSKSVNHTGSIHGKVKATSDGPGLFGATVELFPLESPFKTISTFTEFDGKFYFHNVDKTKKYLVRIKPSYYGREFPPYLGFSRFDLCPSGLTFVPFFVDTNCDEKSFSNPFVIDFSNSESIDLEEIGLRCVDKSNSHFLDSLSSGDVFEFTSVMPSLREFGFWAEEISYLSSWQKEIKIKLNIQELKDSIGESSLVRIGVISQKLGASSPISVSMFSDEEFLNKLFDISGSDIQNSTLFGVPFDSLGEINIDDTLEIRLDQISEEVVFLKGDLVNLKDYLSSDLTKNEKQIFSITDQSDGTISRGTLFIDVVSSAEALAKPNYRGTARCAQGVLSFPFPDLKASQSSSISSPSGADSSGAAIFDCSAGAHSSTYKAEKSILIFMNMTSAFCGLLCFWIFRSIGSIFRAFHQKFR